MMADDFPQVKGVRHRFVVANGIRIHLAEAGVETGRPVLLLHGWPQHWYMWRRVLAGMGDEFRLLAPDLRGFGWTDAPPGSCDGETFVADQVALLDALGIERASVIGHDWGGWTAFLLSLLHPGRLERAIPCNSPHPWPPRGPRLAAQVWRSWYTWILAAPALGPRSVAHGWITRNILLRGNVGAPFTDAEADLYADSFRDPARAMAISRLYRYYQRAVWESTTGRWAETRSTVPTLLLFGQRDRYISPGVLDGYEAHADHMRVELVPDSGHFLVDEKPELVIDRARGFLLDDV